MAEPCTVGCDDVRLGSVLGDGRRVRAAWLVVSTRRRASSGRKLSSRASTGVRSRRAELPAPLRTRSISCAGRTLEGGAVRSGSDITTPTSSRPRKTSSPRLSTRDRCGLAKSRSETTFHPRWSMSATRTLPLRSSAVSSGLGSAFLPVAFFVPESVGRGTEPLSPVSSTIRPVDVRGLGMSPRWGAGTTGSDGHVG
jgi:hypothetical protein